jgi:hypothetical protein
MHHKHTTAEKRIDMRFDKAFPVLVGSELYGDTEAIARNISTGGMLIEMMDPLPMGSVVTIHFEMLDGCGEIVARAEVKHHYCLNYNVGDDPAAVRGIGLRFIEFLDDSQDRLAQSFYRHRTLH